MRWIVFALAAALPFGAVGVDGGASQGCTPCECRVAFCDGDTTYWPTVGSIKVTRVGEDVAVSWQLGLEVTDGEGTSNVTFSGDSTTLAFGSWSVPTESDSAPPASQYEALVTAGNATYPGQQEALVPWDVGRPFFGRLYVQGGHASNEFSMNPGPSTESIPVVSVPVLLGVIVAISVARPRRP